MSTDDARKRFVGSWSLAKTTRVRNGVSSPNTTYGESPQGVITYTDGYMNVVLSSGEAQHRPLGLRLTNDLDSNLREWATMAQHASAYAGPWNVDAAANTVNHGPLVAAVRPDLVGSVQARRFEFAKDEQGTETLTLTADLTESITDTLLWKRIT